MIVFKKFFTAIMIFSFFLLSNANVGAADLNSDFQNLKANYVLPTLPDRIHHRKEQPPLQYTQRQPKKPPKLTIPSRPVATADRRGSVPPKSFGPPRFR